MCLTPFITCQCFWQLEKQGIVRLATAGTHWWGGSRCGGMEETHLHLKIISHLAKCFNIFWQTCSYIFNRPGVAGLFYKHIHDWLTNSGTLSFFSYKSSQQHHNTQIVRSRKLKFWKNVHPPPHFCHMSRVTCHTSHIKCHVSHVICHLSYVFSSWFLFGQCGVTNQ